MKKLFLLDAYAIIYRAYYAFIRNPRVNSKGLNTSRFTTTGLGIADPIATNETAEGKSQNRRVEFAITANDKMVQDAKKETGN